MKVIVLEKAGGIENLITTKIEKPIVNENEVLVEVKALSINPVDFKVRSAEEGLNMMYGEQRPVILGWDISGTVVSVGNNVAKFKVGDNVF